MDEEEEEQEERRGDPHHHDGDNIQKNNDNPYYNDDNLILSSLPQNDYLDMLVCKNYKRSSLEQHPSLVESQPYNTNDDSPEKEPDPMAEQEPTEGIERPAGPDPRFVHLCILRG